MVIVQWLGNRRIATLAFGDGPRAAAAIRGVKPRQIGSTGFTPQFATGRVRAPKAAGGQQPLRKS
jgi:hypothetical protein